MNVITNQNNGEMSSYSKALWELLIIHRLLVLEKQKKQGNDLNQ